MFYQTDGGAIVDASFFCDNATGHYQPTDRQYVVSPGVAGLPEIRQPSPLRVLAIGATAGQRIYFRDEDNQPAVLGYHPDLEQWKFDGYVLQADNMSSYSGSLGATILGTTNITLVLPIETELGISRLGSKTWDLSASPLLIIPAHYLDSLLICHSRISYADSRQSDGRQLELGIGPGDERNSSRQLDANV